MTEMKDDIEEKQNQGIFNVIKEVQVKNLVDDFMEELGKRDDANAQWFVIRWEMAKMDKKTTRVLTFMTFQLLVLSIGLLAIVFWLLKGV